MKKIQLSIIALFFHTLLSGQPLCNFQHYSGENGLSENTVTSMLQDANGFMWFGTWDGLNKFDGYRFKSYKSRVGDVNGLKSNRITDMQEDAYGFIWVQTYDGLVHRFNPRTEKFMLTPQYLPEYTAFQSQIRKMVLVNDKKEIWLLTEEGGCFHVITDGQDNALKVNFFSKENGMLPSNNVKHVFTDNRGVTWLLTGNGLTSISGSDQKSNILLSNLASTDQEQYARPIFSVIEVNDDLYFGSSEGRIWKYSKKDASFKSIKLPFDSSVISIERILADKLMFVSSSSGFCVFDMKNESMKVFNQTTSPDLLCQEFRSSYTDRMGEVWLEPNCDGVAHFNPKTEEVSFFRMKTDDTSPYILLPNFFIFEDINNRLWVHPRGGGFSYYDRNKKSLMYFYNEPGSPTRRFSNLMHSAYSDKQGNLWMCTYSSELEKASFIKENFLKIEPEPGMTAFSANEVREIFEDNERFLWVATKDGTLHLFDQKRKKLGYLTKSGKIAGSGEKFDGMVYAIMQDKDKNIWLGTKGAGLFKLKKTKADGLFECSFENYRFNHENIYSLSNDNIYSLYEDTSGRIWIATYDGGLNVMAHKDGEPVFYNGRNYFKNYPTNECQRVRFVTIDQFGIGWVGTTDGLLVFDSKAKNLEATKFFKYNRVPGDKKSMGGNDVHYILCTKDYVYIAIFGGGLNVTPVTKEINENMQFEVFTSENRLSNDVVLGLVEDNDGNIWMNTKINISKFDPTTKTFENFDKTSGFNSNYFSEAAVLKSYTGELMFGANNGLYVFYPQNMKKSNFVPPIVFSNFQLFGKEMHVGAEGSPLKQDINDTKTITLTHKQNVFSIEFAALDFTGPQYIDYAYKLDGFDDDWSYSNKNRHVTYTNLPHGTYTFSVRSTNSEGVWVNNIRSIVIVIKPSFWQTPWAVLLYVIAGLLVLALGVFILSKFYQLKNKVSVEQKVTNMKLRFFTDISHELRTPLTLIAAPVEHILEKEEISSTVREHLTTVQRNTSRMLRLINQILDFRKVQNKKMKMHIEEIPIGAFVENVSENFSQIATDHNIDFSVNDKTDQATIWADKDKVEKIIFNILSNAFKFTPKGKSIHVFMDKSENDITIRIKDQGAGMSKEKLKNLFERFSSSDSSIQSFQPGTGIGLSLSKEFIDMHHADIQVESEEGEGTTFIIRFLLGTKHYKNDEVDYQIQDGESNEFLQKPDTVSTKDLAVSDNDPNDERSLDQQPDSDLPSLLIIEDNMEVRSFLKMILKDKYQILEADNGKTGLEVALKEIPDFIISDVMMPEMDGMEVTEKIKSNPETSHIPIILLTAKSDKDSQLEGLQYGADDYITKPFSAKHLEIRIENILKQRRIWQQSILEHSGTKEGGGYVDLTPEAPQINRFDQDFVEKIMKIMEENIDNIDFKVDDLVSEMKMGRTVFFKKMKSITGLAPIEFIREMRIKRAAQLIESGQYTVSQITYMVGMNDPRYLSRCFKQKFGLTPSEYKDKYFGKE